MKPVVLATVTEEHFSEPAPVGDSGAHSRSAGQHSLQGANAETGI